MDFLIHIANILYFFSYSVRDIFLLRIITVFAIFFLIPYFYFQPQPLWAPIGWNILFSSINVYRIYLLYIERRPVHLSEKEQYLYNRFFRSLSPKEFSQLISIGSWETKEEDQCLFAENLVLDKMLFISSGQVGIIKNKTCLSKIEEGQFVGALSFLTSEPITANVITLQPTEYISWSIDKLKTLFSENLQLRAAFQTIISNDLVKKIKIA